MSRFEPVEAGVEPWLEPLLTELRAKAAQAKVTATYIRLWETYLHLRRTARTAPDLFRIVKGSLLPGRGTVQPPMQNYRWRLCLPLSELVSVGMGKGELMSGLDKNRVVERFLDLCLGNGLASSFPANEATTNGFDLFWRSIADPRNIRCRATGPCFTTTPGERARSAGCDPAIGA